MGDDRCKRMTSRKTRVGIHQYSMKRRNAQLNVIPRDKSKTAMSCCDVFKAEFKRTNRADKQLADIMAAEMATKAKSDPAASSSDLTNTHSGPSMETHSVPS